MTICNKCWWERRKAKAAKRAQSRKRKGNYENLGEDWNRRKPEQLALIQAPNCEVCKISLKQSMKKYESEFIRDHVVPVRHLTSLHVPGVSREVNLMAICVFCHGRKRAAEERLFRGDVMGFLRVLNEIGWPMERVIKALDSFGCMPENLRHRYA